MSDAAPPQTERDANPIRKWTVEMDRVVENFRILFDSATTREDPVALEELAVYRHRKHQLMSSLLFYTTQIISRGMRLVMKYEVERTFCEVLQSVYMLQQEIFLLVTGFQTTCEQINLKDFRPNPLVLFLKMVLDIEQPRPDINRVQSLLVDLHLQQDSNLQRYTPGMPNCIMALHDPNHDLIISATKDNYSDENLAAASADCWKTQLQRLRLLSSAPDLAANLAHIHNVETLSKDFIAWIKEHGLKRGTTVDIGHEKMREFLAERAEQSTQKRVNLTAPGCALASWNPDGTYKESCLLDYYRFNTNRPENNRGRSMSVFQVDSCAEWFGFIELASTGRPITDDRLPDSLA